MYTYIYGGLSLSLYDSIKKLVQLIIKNPFILCSGKGNAGLSFSASIFGIIGNKKFANPGSYTGSFRTIGATFSNVKGYFSWSSKCTVVGLGLSTTPYSISYSKTNYELVTNFCATISSVFPFLQNKINILQRMAG